MPPTIDTEGTSKLVQVVKDPLGWFTLALILTVSMAGWLMVGKDPVATYVGLGIVALTIVSFGFVVKRGLLTKSDSHVIVTFAFQDEPPTGFDPQQCHADVYGDDSNGTRKVVPYSGPGGWAVRVPATLVKPTDPIQLRLKDSNGVDWETPTFPPLVNTQPLRRKK